MPPGASLWHDPGNLQKQDLFLGPWGADLAPRADAIYAFVRGKHSGVNPGMTVVDPQGREWSVKQITPGALDVEAQVEVALSRLLSAIGYHQPPVYFLRNFTLKDDWGTHTEVGGRFRPSDRDLKEMEPWAWHDNPFIGTRPFKGLLVLMMMFNSTDLKDSNNSVYEHRVGDRVERWYAVRDLGAALGDTNRLGPYKSNPDAFERHPFIVGVTNNFVQFAHHGYYQRYVSQQIRPVDVVWASRLLSQLSDRQWHDAFRAGGYDQATANRFIRRLREKIRQGQSLS
jgi:hypothetical protein